VAAPPRLVVGHGRRGHEGLHGGDLLLHGAAVTAEEGIQLDAEHEDDCQAVEPGHQHQEQPQQCEPVAALKESGPQAGSSRARSH